MPIQSLMLKLPSIFSTLQKTTLQLMFLTISASRSLLRMKKGSLRFKKLRRLLQRKRHIKIVFCVRLSVMRLFQVGYVVQTRRWILSLASHEWFLRRGKERKIFCLWLAPSSEPQIWNFHVIIWHTTSKNCTKRCAACAAWLFFPHSPDQSFELLGCHSHYRFLNSLLSPALIVTAFTQFNQNRKYV